MDWGGRAIIPDIFTESTLKLIGKADKWEGNLFRPIRHTTRILPFVIVQAAPVQPGGKGETTAENDADGRSEKGSPFIFVVDFLCQITRTAHLEIDKDPHGLHKECLPDIQEKLHHHVSFIRDFFGAGIIKIPDIQTRLEGSSESQEPAFPETIAMRGGQGGIGIRFDQTSQLDIPGVPPVIKRELILGRQRNGSQNA